MTMITIHQSFIDESPKLCKNVLHICINQNYEKWFHQIFSHNQVQMISKKLQCSICFRWNFIKFIFLTLATIFWHLLSGPICTLPYLGSSVIQYHLGPQLLHIELHQQNCTKSIHRICAPSQLMIAMCNMCSLTFNTIDSKRNIAKV